MLTPLRLCPKGLASRPSLREIIPYNLNHYLNLK
jgi:hypothetical protein